MAKLNNSILTHGVSFILTGIGDSASPGYAAFNSSRHQLSGIALRRTVVCDSPLSRAIERSDQWVASAGVVSSVRSMIAATFSSVSVRGRPGRGSSESPSLRSFRKRRRHLPTVCPCTPSSSCHRLIGQAVCAAQDHAAAIGQRARDPAASSLTFKIRPFFIAQNQDRHRPANATCHRKDLQIQSQTPRLGVRPHARSEKFSIDKSGKFSVAIDRVWCCG